MKKHYIFLFIYIICYNIFSADILLIILIIHGLIGIYSTIISKSISLLTLVYAAMILGSLADVSLLSNLSSGLHSIYDYIEKQYIQEATLIWCLGNTFIIIGYEIFKKKSFPSIAIEISEKLLKNIFIFILLLDLSSLAGNAISFSFLGGGGAKIISLLNLIIILIFARLWKRDNNSTYRTYALTLFFIQTYIALTTSYLRQELLLPGLSLMGGYFLGLGQMKYLFTYRIIPFLIGISFFISVFKNLQRSHFIDIIYNNNSNSTITEHDSQSEGNDEDKLDKDKGTFLDRVANLAQITCCVKLVKNNGFYYGAASQPLIIALVPRVLWPGKPQIRLGAWFAVAIGVAYADDKGNINNSINMTIPGELYLDFGWIGITIGCILFGGLLAMFWNAARFTLSPYNITGTMWGGYLLLTGLGGFAIGDLQIVITFFSTYLVFYIIKLISRK